MNDPSRRKLHDLALDIGTSAAVAYLDGLRARGEEPVLVLAAAHESALNWYSPLTDLQWDIFPSATCRLRGQGRGEPSEDARVAVVPRLWVEALSKADEPSMGGDYVILAYDLDPILQTNAVCAAVAKALGRACRADMLSCRRWSAMVPSRIAAERAAREAAASVLIRQRDDLFRPHA